MSNYLSDAPRVRDDHRLLDAEEAAWYLHMSPSWVLSAWAARQLPAVKVGRAVRFRIEDLDDFIEAARYDAVYGPLASAK